MQKYAVRVGGGFNHRFGLDDGVLIKDNHIAAAGSLAEAVARVRAAIGHLVKIELEVDTLEQLEEALAPRGRRRAARQYEPRRDAARGRAWSTAAALTEASGRITPQTAPAVAATGVDLLSSGWLTHSVTALDIGLDWR